MRTSDFAAKIGVNRSTISQALLGPLKPAKVRRGLIDLDHPCVAEYERATKTRLEQYAAGMQRRGVKSRSAKQDDSGTTTSAPPVEQTRAKLDDEQVEMLLNDLSEDIRKISHLPLVEIIRRYGTASSLKEYVTSVKYMAQTHKIQLENRQSEGELVDRVLLTALLGVLDGAYIDMLKDGSKNIARRSAQKTLAGDTPEEVEIFVRDTISRYLQIANGKIKLAIQAVEE